jgi:hypothetical protein
MVSANRRIDWKKVIDEIKNDIQYFERGTFKPTLRALFYRLYSKGLIPNTRSSYNSLSRKSAEARLRGQLPIDCFEDNSRSILKDFDRFYALDDYIKGGITYIRNTPLNYVNSIPKWYNQPNYVEVWVEKDAMANSIFSILKDLDIIIVPNRGFSSLTFLNQNVKRLKQITRSNKKIHICYFGDFDPSGEYMDWDLRNRILRMGMNIKELDFQRIAIIEEQIDKYDLPANPDIDTRAKMMKDTRKSYFERKYGKLIAVELDALPAINPEGFYNLVYDSVYKFYDKKIYEKIIEPYTEDYLKKVVKDKISNFNAELQEYY